MLLACYLTLPSVGFAAFGIRATAPGLFARPIRAGFFALLLPGPDLGLNFSATAVTLRLYLAGARIIGLSYLEWGYYIAVDR